MTAPIRVGLISDTHGLLRPAALEFLSGSDLIVHCGDICDAAVLAQLSRIAPVRAVRGNNDAGEWARGLPESDLIRVGEVWIYAIHDIAQIDIDPAAADVAVVLSGHSHKPAINVRDGVTYVNPGSAGPRRFRLPISVGELRVTDRTVTPRIVELPETLSPVSTA